MPFFLITVLLLVMTVGAMQYTKQSFHVCLVANLCIMILVPYCFGLAGRLLWGVYFLRCLLLLDGFFCVFHLMKVAKGKGKWNIPMWDCFLLVVLMSCVWWVIRSRLYQMPEEFAFWGAACKYTVMQDALHPAAAYLGSAAAIPPAQILLQYSVFRILGFTFREDVAMLAAALPMVAAAMYAAGVLAKKHHYLTSVLAGGMLMLAPVVLEASAYTQTLPEQRMGALIALLLMIAILPEPRVIRMILLALVGSVLTLYTPVGIGLSMVTLIGCGCYMAAEKPGDKKGPLEVDGFGKIASAFLPAFVAFVAERSWHYYLLSQGVSGQRLVLGLRALVRIFKERGFTYFGDVLMNFGSQFFTQPAYGSYVHFAPVVWLLVGICLFGLSALLCTKKQRQQVTAAAGLGIGIYLVYLPGLLYLYMFVMDTAAGSQLSGFYRYLSSPLTAFLMAGIAFALWVTAESWKNFISLMMPFVCAIVLVNSVEMNAFLSVARAPAVAAIQTRTARSSCLLAARSIRRLGDDPRVQLITENDGGLAKQTIDYELAPDIILPEQRTVVTFWQSDDPAWYSVHPDVWRWEVQDGFDFVYIYRPSESSFAQDCAEAFEDPAQVTADSLFLVVPQEDGLARLRRIDNGGVTGEYVNPPLFTWQKPIP